MFPYQAVGKGSFASCARFASLQRTAAVRPQIVDLSRASQLNLFDQPGRKSF
jgi:hypothetical protein